MYKLSGGSETQVWISYRLAYNTKLKLGLGLSRLQKMDRANTTAPCG